MTASLPRSKTTSTAVPGTMLPPSIDGVPCSAAQMALLVDQHRELVALAAGKQMEICMALGDRDGARRAMQEMNAQTLARQAVREITTCA